jgi:Flp pilus assembly protein TadD
MTTTPMDGIAALDRASALCELRRWDDAAAQLRTILAADPDNEGGLCLMAQAQLGQAADEQALRTSLSAISLNPDNEWPHRLASRAFAGLGRDQEARAMARDAVRLAPNSAVCHINLAELLAKNRSDLGEASEAADRAVALAPTEAGSHIAVGIVAAADARNEEATAAIMRALALEPDSSRAHNELARLQLKTNRFGNAGGLAQAAAGFATALNTDPRAGVSRGNLDLVLHLFVARIAYGIFLIAVIASRVRSHSDAGFVHLVPALLLILPALFAARFVSRLAPPLRVYLTRQLHKPFIASALVCDAIAASALVVGAAVPQASQIAFWFAAGFSLLAGLTLRLETRRRFQWAINPTHEVPTTLFLVAGAVMWLVVLIAVYGALTIPGGWGQAGIALAVAISLTLGGTVYILRCRKR